MQGNLNLNICEAHAFNTTDKFTLDVFVVNGWSGEVRQDPSSRHPHHSHAEGLIPLELHLQSLVRSCGAGTHA